MKMRSGSVVRLVRHGKSANSSKYSLEVDLLNRKKKELEEEIAGLRSDVDALRQQLKVETPVRVVKRKREVLDEKLLKSAAEYDTNTVCNGDIEISEGGPEGKFIRLRNKSDKEVSLSGWQLIRAGDIYTAHKFDRQAKINAGGTMTIWSSDATDAVHEPPVSIIKKGQKWYTSENFNTVLVNGEGDEQAIRKTRRLQVSRQEKRLGFGQPEELFQQEGGERVERERCVIL